MPPHEDRLGRRITQRLDDFHRPLIPFTQLGFSPSFISSFLQIL